MSRPIHEPFSPRHNNDDLNFFIGAPLGMAIGSILWAAMIGLAVWALGYQWNTTRIWADDTIDRMVAAEHAVSRGLGGE